MHCTQGQALVNTVLVSREQVIPWGIPQLEDRTLETVQQEWGSYQARLTETRSQLNSAIAKLRQMEQKFQHLDTWLKGMENKGQLRSCRRSNKATKEAQLELLKVCEDTLSFNDTVLLVLSLILNVYFVYIMPCIHCVVQGWHEEVLVYQEEIEALSTLAQQVLEETHISSRVSTMATQLTSRYHALLLHLHVIYMHPHV